MGHSRTYILMITAHLIAMATAQEMEKRVPQGFLGMRGKKYDDDSTEQFYKRRPQFFVGVKGKKNYDLLENLEPYYKRAPMGFMGVRGKKEDYPEPIFYPENLEYFPKRDGSLIGQIDYSSNELQNDEFPLLNDLLSEYLNKLSKANSEVPESNERITNEIEKRAAGIHQFFGVRGKKSIPEKRPYDLSFRGKFIGVRGKKDLKNSGAQEIRFLVGSNSQLPKRKGTMGFIGMRGKKWIDESSPEMEMPN
ncbi:hypothetical protein K1T71_012347 [Dendrolimus kikuchii]|uniref:Uncharacterized protein n=1 Tax=Dendrolimus kikuchii TaxID=765133 RepID=A0ACC1CLR0_9NEOP|nr:hypothetical protein K1T71_012347 [Dendrolimus kikuchii]